MKLACRNILSFAEQYCSVAKISRIKTTASFKLVQLMSNTSSAARKTTTTTTPPPLKGREVVDRRLPYVGVRNSPGTNPLFEGMPSDRLARPRADKCDRKHGTRMFGCQSPTGRG
jgi:hypothetical protein